MNHFAEIPISPVHAYQNLTEFGMLWEFVAARKPKNVLEIGSLFGGTLWYWSHLPELQVLVSADLIPPNRPDIYDSVVAARNQWPSWYEHVDFHAVEGDTHTSDVFRAVKDTLPKDILFDFIFVDGDHTYEGVAQDFDMYTHLLRDGGVVAFHDTIQNGNRFEPGVFKFVAELKWQYPWAEFFHWDGVGICAFVID